MPAPVTLYRTSICPYCVMAARLLDKRGIAYEEISLDNKPAERAALQERTQFLTVPQIFVGQHFVCGYTDLAAIERSGELDRLLAQVST